MWIWPGGIWPKPELSLHCARLGARTGVRGFDEKALWLFFGDFYSDKWKKVATNFQNALKKSQNSGYETLP
jgi:hypothetical protein